MMTGATVRRVLLGAWTALLLSILFPWADLLHHPHWMNVVWIPFTPPLRLRDVVANVLLFTPFGTLLRISQPRGARVPVWVVMSLSAALSFLAEATQLFTHTRVPSVTDLVTNVIGAAAGCWLARFVV
jgi:glycopeptide antibiotics resistance protein